MTDEYYDFGTAKVRLSTWFLIIFFIRVVLFIFLLSVPAMFLAPGETVWSWGSLIWVAVVLALTARALFRFFKKPIVSSADFSVDGIIINVIPFIHKKYSWEDIDKVNHEKFMGGNGFCFYRKEEIAFIVDDLITSFTKNDAWPFIRLLEQKLSRERLGIKDYKKNY